MPNTIMLPSSYKDLNKANKIEFNEKRCFLLCHMKKSRRYVTTILLNCPFKYTSQVVRAVKSYLRHNSASSCLVDFLKDFT